MKILNLSIDITAFEKDSPFAARLSEYATLVERYDVLAPTSTYADVRVADNCTVYAAKGNGKLSQFGALYRVAQKLCRQNKYDVVTSQDPYFVGLIAYLIAKKFRIGFELQFHGFVKKGSVRTVLATWLTRRADHIRVVSERLKKELVGNFCIAEDTITVAPIYVENAVKTQDAMRNNTICKFLTVGRLVPVKHISLQIEAAHILKQKNKAFHLTIVGDGTLRADLEKLVAKYNLESTVSFVGAKNRAELDKLYAASDCFLLSSDREGWGMVVIEAASHRLPIVMTDVGCAGEVIEHEKSGLVVPVGNVEVFAVAMERVIDDAALRTRLGNNAYNAVQSLPSKEEVQRRMVASWSAAKCT